MSIAEKLIALRGSESRTAFAARLEISPNTLRNYEAGLSLPNSDMVAKMCTALHLDPGWLLFGDENETPSIVSPSETVTSKHSLHDIESRQTAKTGNFRKINDTLDVFSLRTSWELVRVLSQNAKFYVSVSFLYSRNDKNKNQIKHPGTIVNILMKRSDGGYDFYKTHELCTANDFFVVEFVDLLLTLCRHGIDTFEAHLERTDIDKIIDTLGSNKREDMDVESVAFGESVKVPTVLYSFFEHYGPEEENMGTDNEG